MVNFISRWFLYAKNPVKSLLHRQLKDGRRTSGYQTTYCIVSLTSAIIIITLQIYSFVMYFTRGAFDNSRGMITFWTLFVFAQLFQVYLTFEGIYKQNSIQIWFLAVFYILLTVYSGIQLYEFNKLDYWKSSSSKGANISLGLIIGFHFITSIIQIGITWKVCSGLNYKIGINLTANRRLQELYKIYLIYITILKLDFFFFLGFTIQFAVIMKGATDPEFYITIIFIPVTIIILIFAALFAKTENKVGMCVIFLCYLAAFIYFLYKLIKISRSFFVEDYGWIAKTELTVGKSMVTFAAITIAMLLVTCFIAILRMRGFGEGLKERLAHVSANSNDNDSSVQSLMSSSSTYEGRVDIIHPGNVALPANRDPAADQLLERNRQITPITEEGWDIFVNRPNMVALV